MENYLSMNQYFTDLLNFNWDKPGFEDSDLYDIYTKDNDLVFEIPVSGKKKKDLSITRQGNILEVKCVNSAVEDSNRKYIIRKNITKKLGLKFELSDKTDLSKLDAKLESGVLTITIPFKEEQKPQVITIK